MQTWMAYVVSECFLLCLQSSVAVVIFSDGSLSLFFCENNKKIQAHLQFVLIKLGLHLRLLISCWCLFPFAIYFIPAAPPCPLNTLPTSFSKQKINRLEVTWLPSSSFPYLRLPPFPFSGRTEGGEKNHQLYDLPLCVPPSAISSQSKALNVPTIQISSVFLGLHAITRHIH